LGKPANESPGRELQLSTSCNPHPAGVRACLKGEFSGCSLFLIIFKLWYKSTPRRGNRGTNALSAPNFGLKFSSRPPPVFTTCRTVGWPSAQKGGVKRLLFGCEAEKRMFQVSHQRPKNECFRCPTMGHGTRLGAFSIHRWCPTCGWRPKNECFRCPTMGHGRGPFQFQFPASQVCTCELLLRGAWLRAPADDCRNCKAVAHT